MNTIKFIRTLERLNYPKGYRQMQHITTMEDIVEYCEADDIQDLVVMTGPTWYFLAVKSTCEIVDIAGKLTLKDLITIKRSLIQIFSGKTVTLDARESTSYKLVRRLGSITRDHVYMWNGERFHELEVFIRG